MKAFLDSSAIIFAIEFENTNSAIILEMILNGELEGIINEKVLAELKRYFRKRKDRNFAFLAESLLLSNFTVKDITPKDLKIWEGHIKRKDLEHLTTVKKYEIEYLIAFDEDYEPFEEYITPNNFVKNVLKKKARDTEY